MKLRDVYCAGRLPISIELFPPKTAAGLEALFGHVESLMNYAPSYMTCTYGAGGSTRDKTLEIVSRIKQDYQLAVATHLTLVGSTVNQLRDYLSNARKQAVDFVVALRGDPPQGSREFQPSPGGFRYAAELVGLIKSEFPEFGIAVAGYPEKHQEAPSFEVDANYLRDKVRAGADIVITQLFYDNADFFRFRDRCEQLGIDVPIIPGILPITNLGQVQRIASLCGSKIPSPLVQRLAEKDDPDWQMAVGVEFATNQVGQLIESGIPGIHFYVLNQSRSLQRILDNLQFSRSHTAS